MIGLTPLSIQTTYPKVQIDRQLPRVTIDQYQCFAEAGLKNAKDFTADSVSYAYSKAAEGIDTIVSEGNAMGAIETGNFNIITDTAFDSGLGQKEFNVDIIPKSRPKIEVEGHLNIEYEMGKVNFYKESMLEQKYKTTMGGLVDVKL
ncbi:DUF6470 family protein [Anaerosalibacter sp. Marseille-P3206]|uniref:DUF6470 family protein n=1 Tax=Anaerosalibacter sp. Marseille-P3206 TaxID=1871005 RepID=UPI0009864C10|nr:DUF6470 family protein [Anaerosalibacter sp. Marseille-P3206]